MKGTTIPDINISIDMKKYRIRIHKTTLHALGNPRWIQLLINPEERVVAIKTLNHFIPQGQTYEVTKKMLSSDNSIEIYSRLFITRLRELNDGLSDGELYHMSGTIISTENIAIFLLDTLTASIR